jgi:hypothetical protein
VVAFAIAAVMVVATTLFSLELRRQTLATARGLVAGISQITAERTSQTLVAADLLLRSIGTVVAEADTRSSRDDERTRYLQASLERLRGLPPQVGDDAILDANGVVVATGAAFPPGMSTDLSGTGMFQSLRRDPGQGLVIDGPVKSGLTGQWVVSMGRALGGRWRPVYRSGDGGDDRRVLRGLLLDHRHGAGGIGGADIRRCADDRAMAEGR